MLLPAHTYRALSETSFLFRFPATLMIRSTHVMHMRAQSWGEILVEPDQGMCEDRRKQACRHAGVVWVWRGRCPLTRASAALYCVRHEYCRRHHSESGGPDCPRRYHDDVRAYLSAKPSRWVAR